MRDLLVQVPKEVSDEWDNEGGVVQPPHNGLQFMFRQIPFSQGIGNVLYPCHILVPRESDG
jgi:hypothetical protein